MPGLQFQNLPAAQTRKIRDTLHAQWQIEAGALNKSHFSDRGKFETAKAKLNAKYQQMELKEFTQLQQQVEEQQRVQTLIRQPQERTRAEEAQERMRLGPEAERLVFPTERRGRFSPQQMWGKGGLAEHMGEWIDATTITGARFGFGGTRKQSNLIKQYVGVSERAGYNDFTPEQKRQYNLVWDDMMASDEKNEWNPNSPEVKAVRAVGKLQQAAAKNITPLGASVRRKKKQFTIPGYAGLYSAKVAKGIVSAVQPKQKTLDKTTAQQILKQAKGDKEVARRIAREQGYEL